MAQRGRDRPAQPVAPETQPLELSQSAQFRRNRPAQLVVPEIQILEMDQPTQLRRNRPAQLVAPEIQHLELVQPSQFRQDRSAQLVVPEIQPLELRQPGQFRWDRPVQLVALEIQILEMDQPTQLRRNRPAQLVVHETQILEPIQLAQRGRDRPAQLVVPENQTCDPTVFIRIGPVPLRQRGVAQPVGIVFPLRPAGGMIERLQHLPVGHSLGPRVPDGHRGRLRIAGDEAGRQRPPEAEHHRLVGIEGGVPDSRDREGRLVLRSQDGDTLRHPRIVCGARPVARCGRQGNLHRRLRLQGLIDHAYPHRDVLALPYLVARLGEEDPPRPIAVKTRGKEQVQRFQPCPEGGILRHAHVGLLNVKHHEFRHLPQVPGDRPAQLGEPEIQLLEMLQPAQFRRNRPAKLVDPEIQPLEVLQPAQFRRNRPAQLVASETQTLELNQPAQFRRNRPAQLVASEIQLLQLMQPAQFRRNRPPQPRGRRPQPDVPEQQTRDPAGLVRIDPAPLRQRGVAEPVGGVLPARPAGRVVERLQHLPVGHGVAPTGDAPRRGRQVGPVPAPLPGRAPVVDHPVGQEGVVAGHLSDPHVALGGTRSVLPQHGVELTPPPGRDPQAGHGVDQPPRRPVVDLQGEEALSPVPLSRVDQGQVAPVLPVLPQPLHPGLLLEPLPPGRRRVEDPVAPAPAGGAGARPDRDPAHVPALRPGEQRPGQPAPRPAHSLHTLPPQLRVDHIRDDPLPAGANLQAEAGRAVPRRESLGHEAELQPPGLPRDVRHRQLAPELLRLHDHRQRLPHHPPQRSRPQRKDERPVRGRVVVDDPVGVEGRRAPRPLHLHIAVVNPGTVQNRVVLMEPSRGQHHLRQHPRPALVPVARIHRGPQPHIPLPRRPHVLQGHVRAVPAVLPQPAQIEDSRKSVDGGHPRIGQARPPPGHPRGGPHRHPHLGGPPNLHPQRPGPAPTSRNRNVQTPQVADGVRFDPLPTRPQAVGPRPASPAPMGRVGVVEPRLLPPPVGQGQLRGEQGVVPSGRGQHDRDEQDRRGPRVQGGGREPAGRKGDRPPRDPRAGTLPRQQAQGRRRQPPRQTLVRAPPRGLHGILPR